MAIGLDLIVPMKAPHTGKSRLRGACSRADSDERHGELVMALAADTVAAAVAAAAVRTVLVVTADPLGSRPLREQGVELLDEDGTGGLNSALRHAERLLRARDPSSVLGVLQADLPALRPDELSAAVREADERRAFAADRHGTGTTLLLSAPAGPLTPRFGPGSASAHAASGAVGLDLAAASLRADVDTPADLAHARELGLGDRTAALLRETCVLS